MRKMFTLGFQMCSSNSISGMQIGVVKKKGTILYHKNLLELKSSMNIVYKRCIDVFRE